MAYFNEHEDKKSGFCYGRALLLIWININPSMDKEFYPL